VMSITVLMTECTAPALICGDTSLVLPRLHRSAR
jgi:hypothetical protein